VSEQTTQRLIEVTATAAARRAEADALKQRCLAEVTSGMAARVDEIAKRIAHAQPDVAKRLGSTGIQTLRKELIEQAELIAAELLTAADQLEWPTRQSEHSSIGPRDIHSALFNYLYGRRMNSIAAIFKRHGFAVHDNNAQQSQGLIYPQSFYNESDFVELAEALNALGNAEKAVTDAKAEDDRDTIDALWGD
jgi:hypothetical protein